MNKKSKMFFYINTSKNLHSLTMKPLFKVVNKTETAGKTYISAKLTTKEVTVLLLSGEKIKLNTKVATYLSHKRGFYDAVLKKLDKHTDTLIHYNDKIIRARKPEMKQKWKGMRGVCWKQINHIRVLRNTLLKTK